MLDPERVIADANIDRFALGKTLDVEYLGRFSADVVETAAERLPEPERTCVLRTVLARLGDDGWTGWNLARAGAQDYRNVLASVGKPVNPARGCAV